MSIHKLTAGSGYDYLTRQVAAMDATEKGHVGLATYYTEKGETPGVWVGSGMDGIDGLEAGDVVSADHMQALFGSGHHPLAHERLKELDRRIGRPDESSPTAAEYQNASRLGAPYRVYDNDVSAFRVEVAKRLAALNEAAGLPSDWPVPAEDRARIRTEVAREFFVEEHGREPGDARELAATIAKHSRPQTQAVAGYDLTFSPVKSVSTLWAVADQPTAAKVELAHQRAVKDALDFIEAQALFTRTGTNGVRQVDVRGLVATAFTHRDSRAGDPDLHTHVAVANKVQTLDGRWLAIDGRVLYKATVAASETYNTALEKHLTDQLGVRFEARPDADARKRAVREIVGVDPVMNQRWSARRAVIEVRREELATDFQATHGRPPSPVEAIRLAQQATLETREAKHEPRSLAEQRAAWHAQAVEVLGGEPQLQQMLSATLSRNPTGHDPVPDARWVAAAANRIVAAMEQRRSTWQTWHVRAEAQRQVRATGVPTDKVDKLVDLLVGEVLDARSVSLARPSDGVAEPPLLRRADGASVYTVAGANLYTSTAVVEAEQRIVAAAGRHDGHVVSTDAVDVALLESAANGLELNAGQATLVREMAASGARVQLAIAPAGSGKTTAMAALSRAWSEGGGTVVGLAPSAAAAAALGEQIEASTDTLAKLTWSLDHSAGSAAAAEVPEWVNRIGPQTLVVIDEAGMADTLSLDAAVAFITDRGGSVRLIGDDQQLAAIGAGGVLRDIQATHRALRLTELMRFADPAEGAASLALREGRTEGLGFYLDRQRVHVGDLATMTEDVFGSWQADRAKGLDAIMLAPTRELVAELNQRARAHRLDGPPERATGPVTRLADGNEASIGELIITRTNDRRLRTSASDWVKNGDRWTVLDIHPDNAGAGSELIVQHTQNGRTVRLPADYVQASTELGYATTVHTAQGVSVDTMHGLASGQESRQQLYTMLTRGSLANHVYLQVVGDGDPHSVIRPDVVRPLTPTDLLEQMLARDDAPQSATSLMREQADPAVRLGEATTRYLDSLYVAAEDLARHHFDGDLVERLESVVEQQLPGLADEAAWPPLRAHLLLMAAAGGDPLAQLQAATADRELHTAHDRAAVLDWRLDASGLRNAGRGPLPWLPAVPQALAAHPQWGEYLAQRSELVTSLATQVHERAEAAEVLPVWAQNGTRPDPATLADVEVWRASTRVPPEDRRPTGPPQLQKAPATWQRRLNRRVTGDRTPALREWRHLLHTLSPAVRGDEFTPLLAERLAAISRAGLNARERLRTAAAAGDLPDSHPAAALWWRLSRHLSPAVSDQIHDAHPTLHTDWEHRLAELLGPDRAAAVQASGWWPALVTTLDHGLQRGWQLDDLVRPDHSAGDDVDECQALVWRASIALDPIPEAEEHEYHYDEPPSDLWDGVEPPADAHVVDPAAVPVDWHITDQADSRTLIPDRGEDAVPSDDRVTAQLQLAAMARELRVPPEPTDAETNRMVARAAEWDHSPVTRQRMLQINHITQQFFADRFPASWSRDHLTDRFGVDLTGHEHFRPGHAPAGWTHLVHHLRRQGVTDQEMLAAGVATQARTGRLIDRFRDRAMFPITHRGEILGFVGRRHPQLTDDDKGGPKYLNTPETLLFRKGAQLFGVVDDLVQAGAVPTVVEGPMDAVAVTLATAGTHVGVSPLGTSLTDEQAAQLATLYAAGKRDPVVATDADLAGRVAAERDYWMLTATGLDPDYAQFPPGSDPADLLAHRGPAALAAALRTAWPLADELLTERLSNLPPQQGQLEAAKVLAARPGQGWDTGVERISQQLDRPTDQVRRDLHTAVTSWDHNPRTAAQAALNDSTRVRARLEQATTQPESPSERWAPVAADLDPRLVGQRDWPLLAEIMQDAHDQGHDVPTAARALINEAPLGDKPAKDLRNRLVTSLDVELDAGVPAPAPATPGRGIDHDRRQAPVLQKSPSNAPRR